MTSQQKIVKIDSEVYHPPPIPQSPASFNEAPSSHPPPAEKVSALSGCTGARWLAIIVWQVRYIQYLLACQNIPWICWEKCQWILPLYMKPISFQSKASVVCSVTAAVFMDFCLKKLNVFSQHIGKKKNEYLNSREQIPRNWNVDQLSMLITSWDIT